MVQILIVLALIPFALLGVWILKTVSVVLYKKFGGKTLGISALVVLALVGVLLFFPALP